VIIVIITVLILIHKTNS